MIVLGQQPQFSRANQMLTTLLQMLFFCLGTFYLSAACHLVFKILLLFLWFFFLDEKKKERKRARGISPIVFDRSGSSASESYAGILGFYCLSS